MHLAEGIAAPEVLVAGAAATVAGTAIGLYKLDADDLPKTAMMAAAFFVAGLIHVPIGPVTAHLVLNGLMGLMLGWAAFPAILVAVTLQLVFFGHGGLTTLGINVFAMAGPAIVCYYLFRGRLRTAGHRSATTIGAAAGAIAIAGGAVVIASALVLSGDEFRAVAAAMAAAHLPVMVIESIVTASVVGFLMKVRPEALRMAEPAVVTDERSFA